MIRLAQRIGGITLNGPGYVSHLGADLSQQLLGVEALLSGAGRYGRLLAALRRSIDAPVVCEV